MASRPRIIFTDPAAMRQPIHKHVEFPLYTRVQTNADNAPRLSDDDICKQVGELQPDDHINLFLLLEYISHRGYHQVGKSLEYDLKALSDKARRVVESFLQISRNQS